MTNDGCKMTCAMNTSNNQDGWYNVVYDYGAQIITDDHKGTTIGSDEGKAAMDNSVNLLSVRYEGQQVCK